MATKKVQSKKTTKRMTPVEFAAKVEWEGGTFGALEYGLSAEEVPLEVSDTWRKAVGLYEALEPLLTAIADYTFEQEV